MKNYKLLNTLTVLLGIFSLVLILALGWFTYENYNRERKLMENNLFQEAEFIRTSLRAKLLMGIGGDLHKLREYVERLEASKFVKHILVFDKDKNNLLGDEGYYFDENNNDRSQHQEIRLDSEQNHVYTFISEIEFRYDIKTGQRVENSKPGIKYTTVIELYANEYYEAQTEDIRRALGTGLILLVIGFASVFFIFVLRRYYLVNVYLQNVQKYISNVIQSIPNGLISFDRAGRIETINRTALRILKLEDTEPTGKQVQDVIPNCKTEMAVNFESDKLEQQIECHLKDGSSIPLNIISSKITDEKNETIGTVIILSDLRELKSLEKAVERSERLASLGRMAAGIAHEIRNPLSSIKGFSQYFRNKFENQTEDWNYAVMMGKEVDRLNRVIQELLNFARPREMNLQLIEIQPLIQHALKLIQTDLKEKKIHVQVEMDATQPILALADSDMITQVLLNLFINALDSMKKDGQLIIDVSDLKDFVTIKISDNGCGIAQQDISYIFDPFFTTKKSGTGLGLSIVYRLIEQIRGEIEVQSEVGKGTTFKIDLRKRI
ncbi:MAG: hypothetical protein CMF23_15750 [Ignavibacteriae bacterium]|nr:hypothetical protein [Ignavibacteriota bacterium]